MRRVMLASGWIQKDGIRSLPIEVEAAFFADEMERFRSERKSMEFRAKLFAARQEKKPQVGLALEAVQLPRWYRGQTNLEEQYVN